ncbi:MAG: gliding motility-associated C-terminal domain-containing protein [Chitinophagaceae bacterium]
MYIYNRWDNLVYQSKNYTNNWDGKGLSNGTYYYILKIKRDNNTWDIRKGWVMILR